VVNTCNRGAFMQETGIAEVQDSSVLHSLDVSILHFVNSAAL